ncbi:MAG: EAL domain-containing protein, partial [Trebonia sp.]
LVRCRRAGCAPAAYGWRSTTWEPGFVSSPYRAHRARVIKLDRTIIDGVSGDAVLTTLVRPLVEFGHGCGAGVVAEGVETAADAETLRALGVDYGQGWHFGRPGSPRLG